LVLNHRRKQSAPRPPAPPESGKSRNEEKEEHTEDQAEAKDRIFPLERRAAPELRLNVADSISRGRTAAVDNVREPALDVVASFTQSFRNTGTASLKSDQLVFRTPPATSGVRFIFVVDTSGSHAAQQRMRAVKGTAAALLESSVDHKDEIAVISFRGAKASALILITDGRANVPRTGTDPWNDALEAAGKLHCPSVLVDSSIDGSGGSALDALAAAMGGSRIHMDDLSQETLRNIPRP
jgi:magnesium chelatase subunit D